MTDGVGARGRETEASCAALLDMLAAGTRASCETNGGVPYSAAGGRVGCDVPPSSCHFPVRKVPGSRAFGFPLGLCQPRSAFRERPREQTRRARVGHHHGDQTCMGYRGYCCDCLPAPGPGGTLAIDLNDGDNFYMVVRARRLAVAAVASHTCSPPSVFVIVTKLAENLCIIMFL